MESEALPIPWGHKPPAIGFSLFTHAALAKEAEQKPYCSLPGTVLLDTPPRDMLTLTMTLSIHSGQGRVA